MTVEDHFELEAEMLLRKHADERDRKREDKRRELNQLEIWVQDMLLTLAGKCVAFVDMERRKRGMTYNLTGSVI
jgi:hypothetical protein